MSKIHRLVREHGHANARLMVPAEERHLVDNAAYILAQETLSLGITYSGFCLTALPHRQLGTEERWERRGHNITLVVEPGVLFDHQGVTKVHGVPYGSRARMILLYLQTRAVQASSPEVELGRSMRDWLGRMGVSIGGKTVREIRDQADRISACRLTFLWHGEKQNAFTKDSIVQHGIQFYDKTDNQMQLWVDTVKLSPTFYAALKDHPVPVAEAALQKISNSSLALDIYIWLAYRLHSIQQPTPVSWSALHTQFGAGYKLVRQFKSRFIGPLKEALSVYPEARIDLDEKGIVLRPSPPPIAKHTYQVLLNSA